MPSDALICCCRFCSRTFSYAPSEAGCQSRCPHCGQTLLLPGHLQLIAIKRRERVNSFPVIAMEAGGFALMFFWPFGTILGMFLVFFGWRQSYKLRCGNCDSVIDKRGAQKCRNCKAQFASE